MHILVSNDDGFQAPGLTSLVACIEGLGHRVTVVSTKKNRSGYGQSLSLRKGIEVKEVSPNFYVVDGTPADCVYIGLHNLLKEPVDLVISGINNGANLADDILYSGTFAAAMEARRNRLPSIAISITELDVQHYDTATAVISDILTTMSVFPTNPELAVLNVNLPDMPFSEIKGYKVTALGKRLKAQKPELKIDEHGKHRYWLGFAGKFESLDKLPKIKQMYDFEAVEAGYVSITPVASQLIAQPFYDEVQTWINTL